ncbi:hypothetical protein TWF106_008800 [Orbilia oligospora]|uniref:Uncharacterized protein n=1 Tax=Orbilia oligospora TaxID=2813651 RepID=A0A7C8PSI4_ORBOL|nr:hypothetical protein TWF788_007665 [Orbilia oligospora]KAF3215293.1 hypothetical protein TWF106_008800 [Orbilia oligospora]
MRTPSRVFTHIQRPGIGLSAIQRTVVRNFGLDTNCDQPTTAKSENMIREENVIREVEKVFRSPSSAAFLIRQFRKAGIECTDPGIQVIENTCARLRCKPSVIAWSRSPLGKFYTAFEREMFSGPVDLSHRSLYSTEVGLLWRSEYIYYRYRRYKTFVIWEALYHRSRFFRKIMDVEEYENADEVNGDCIATSKTWYILDLMYDWGVFVREDVDGLPDPIGYSRPGQRCRYLEEGSTVSEGDKDAPGQSQE